MPTGANPAYDSRFKYRSMAVGVTPEILARFEPGTALVRATAHGRPQWLPTPPPEARAVAVEIRQQRR